VPVEVGRGGALGDVLGGVQSTAVHFHVAVDLDVVLEVVNQLHGEGKREGGMICKTQQVKMDNAHSVADVREDCTSGR
jgi:hypothetical protein